MKKFKDWELTEASTPMPGGIRDELNKLQAWWSANAGPKGFLDQADAGKGTKYSLMPILEPPFDMIRSGGILVLGYNPGAGGGVEFLKKLVADVRKQDDAGNMPLLYDKSKGGWHYTRDLRRGTDNIRRKRYEKRGEDIKISALNSSDWLSRKSVNKNLHKKGSFPYHRAFNKMLDDLGLESYRERTMTTNFIPFNSKKDNIPYKREVEKVSAPWVKAFIKASKPKIIFCPMKTYDLTMKLLGGKSDSRSKQIRKLSNNHRFYEAGILADGTPIVGFAHWSQSSVGGPSNPNWTEENVEAMSKDIKRLMKI